MELCLPGASCWTSQCKACLPTKSSRFPGRGGVCLSYHTRRDDNPFHLHGVNTSCIGGQNVFFWWSARRINSMLSKPLGADITSSIPFVATSWAEEPAQATTSPFASLPTNLVRCSSVATLTSISKRESPYSPHLPSADCDSSGDWSSSLLRMRLIPLWLIMWTVSGLTRDGKLTSHAADGGICARFITSRALTDSSSRFPPEDACEQVFRHIIKFSFSLQASRPSSLPDCRFFFFSSLYCIERHE